MSVKLPNIASASVITPTAGQVIVFADATNSDHVTVMDSDGNFYDLTKNTGDLTFAPAAVLGPLETFTSVDYGTEVDVIIPGVLEITRDDNKGLYNTIEEDVFDQSGHTSPLYTEWNSANTAINNIGNIGSGGKLGGGTMGESGSVGNSANTDILYGWSDLTNLGSRTFDTWTNAHNYDPVGSIGTEQIMKESTTGRQWLFKLLAWTSGNAGGGFSYSRQEILSVGTPGTITFSDGTTMTTAPITPVDNTNTWNIPDTAFVDPFYGNDSTAVPGDGNLPYNSVIAANNAGVTNIYLKSGSHSLVLAENKNYYAAPGASAYNVTDNGVAVTNVRITGYLQVNDTLGITLTGSGSQVYAEVLKLSGAGCGRLFNASTLYLKVTEGITCSGLNGAGYASTVRDGSKLIIDTPYHYTNYWAVSFAGNNNHYELRCPDVKILDGGGYGNIAKSLINQQAGMSQNVVIINLLGGTLINENLSQTTSFGVLDSTLLIYVAGTDHKFIYKNGTVQSGAMYGLVLYWSCRIELENLKIKNNTSSFLLRSSNAYATIKATNCEFDGELTNTLGNNLIVDFTGCTFKVNDIGESYIIDFVDINRINPSAITFKDCYAQLADAGNGEFLGSFADVSPGVDASVGLLNCYSTEPIGAGVSDIFDGYTQVQTLTLPQIN